MELLWVHVDWGLSYVFTFLHFNDGGVSRNFTLFMSDTQQVKISILQIKTGGCSIHCLYKSEFFRVCHVRTLKIEV